MFDNVKINQVFNEFVSDGYLILSVLHQLSQKNPRVIANRFFWLMRFTFNLSDYTIFYALHYLNEKGVIQIHVPIGQQLPDVLINIPEDAFISLVSTETAGYCKRQSYEKLSSFHKQVFDKLPLLDLNNYQNEVKPIDLINFTFDVGDKD